MKSETSGITEYDFLTLLEKYRDDFYQFIYRMAWNKEDVDDIFSEAVMVAWQQRETFQSGTNFRAWFFRILLNKSYIANRYNLRNTLCEEVGEQTEEQEELKRIPKPITSTVVSSSSNGSGYYLDRLDDLLLEAIEQLREPEKQCILLRAWEDYSYREIAHILNIPVGTVMTHLARGRNKIRQFLRAAARKGRKVLSLHKKNQKLSPIQSVKTKCINPEKCEVVTT